MDTEREWPDPMVDDFRPDPRGGSRKQITFACQTRETFERIKKAIFASVPPALLPEGAEETTWIAVYRHLPRDPNGPVSYAFLGWAMLAAIAPFALAFLGVCAVGLFEIAAKLWR